MPPPALHDSRIQNYATKLRQARERLPELQALLNPCRLCPRQCAALRGQGEAGECGMADELLVSMVGLHHGNEPVISGQRGSGNVFLSGCNLRCIYCQNWEVSQLRDGSIYPPEVLATVMLGLQRQGAHNINCVTPTHVVPLLIEAFALAWEQGLALPFVYNTSGYDSLEVLRLLEGLVDVYLPDMKYGDAETAQELSGIAEYPLHNQAAVREMYRQVGDLVLNEEGVAVRGVLVRHLVLPGDLGLSEKILDFLDRELPGPVHVNVMAQYRPCYQAAAHPALGRRVSAAEVDAVLERARRRPGITLLEPAMA